MGDMPAKLQSESSEGQNACEFLMGGLRRTGCSRNFRSGQDGCESLESQDASAYSEVAPELLGGRQGYESSEGLDTREI